MDINGVSLNLNLPLDSSLFDLEYKLSTNWRKNALRQFFDLLQYLLYPVQNLQDFLYHKYKTQKQSRSHPSYQIKRSSCTQS